MDNYIQSGQLIADVINAKQKNKTAALGNKVNDNKIEITSSELQFIISGIDLSSIKKRIRYEHRFVSKYSVESGVVAQV